MPRVPELQPYQWPDVAQIEQNALANTMSAQKLKDYPEGRNWLLKQREYATTKMGWEEEDRLREQEMRPMKDESEALDYLIKRAPMITWGNYAQRREHLITRNRINPMLLPEATWFESEAMKRGVDPEVFFETWKQKSLETAAQRLARTQAEVKPVKDTDTELAELRKDFLRAQIDQKRNPPAGDKLAKDQGMKLRKEFNALPDVKDYQRGIRPAPRGIPGAPPSAPNA